MSTELPTHTRRRARERALEYLFGLDFTKYHWAEDLETFWEEHPEKPGVRGYADKLIQGVADNQPALDAQIQPALENWSPDRIGAVERAVLRIALYEMLHATDVPHGVAINEAIELTKSYGAEESPRFVNGVLDRLRKQLAS